MEAKEICLRNEDLFHFYLDTIDIPYVRDDWQVDISKKKLSLVDAPIYLRETVDRRARGASKTFDTMEIALFLAWIGYRGIWFASGRDQLEQPKIYLKYIIDRSRLLQRRIKLLLKESVDFESGGFLKLRNLTELNARSSRADFIVYDEEAQADGEAYNAAVSILVGSDLCFVFHISTPAKATVFEENYDRIRRRETETGHKLTYRVIWDQASWLKAKSEWYEEQKRIQPAWYYRQEHEASFELPSGAVFQNVEYGEYPDWLMFKIEHQSLCSGVDWNPVNGHWLVGGKWTPDMMNFVFLEAHDIGKGYAVDMNKDQFYVIANHGIQGKHITMEKSGINEEYIHWFKKLIDEFQFYGDNPNFHYEEWDVQGIEKQKIVTYIIQNGITLWCNKQREDLRILAKMIEDCKWDSKSPVPKLFKNPADSPHALDAGLHAISEKNRMDSKVEIGRFY